MVSSSPRGGREGNKTECFFNNIKKYLFYNEKLGGDFLIMLKKHCVDSLKGGRARMEKPSTTTPGAYSFL